MAHQSHDELHQRFKGVDRHAPEEANEVATVDLAEAFVVLYVFTEGVGDPPGYNVMSNKFGRWAPGRKYMVVDPETGEMRDSTEYFKANATGDQVPAQTQLATLCGNAACPNREAALQHVLATGDTDGGLKLKRCAGCHLTRYCSAACQRADWKVHKAVCIAGGKGRKGSEGKP